MNDMYQKASEIFELIDMIFSDDFESFFSYKKLQNKMNLTLGELRTILDILCEYNFVYSKKKIGLFKNLEHIRNFKDCVFTEVIEGDKTIIRSDKTRLEMNTFEYSILDYYPNKKLSSQKVMTIIVLAHMNFNFYYKKDTIIDGEYLVQIRTALRCNDDEEIFNEQLRLKKVTIYK